MPNGTGEGIARGFEIGAKNFLDSFLAVKQHREQEKYRKLSPVIQAVYSQIQNRDTPLDQRIKAMDALPYILDPKYKGSKLSTQLGLDKLAEQQMTEQEGIEGSAAKDVVDPNAVKANKRIQKNPAAATFNPQETLENTELPMAESVSNAGTESTKPLLRRRGELSDNDVELINRKRIIKAENEDAFNKQYKMALVNADLQSRTLAQQGWKGNDDWNYNEEAKTWSQTWFNPITKENYTQSLTPGVVPQAVILKQIQSGGKGGPSAAFKDLQRSVAVTMNKEFDDPEVIAATSKLWKDNFQSKLINTKQNITGTEPIQPNQKVTNDFKKLELQQKHSELVASAGASSTALSSLDDTRKTALANAKSAKADFDKAKDEYESDEPEYQTAQNAYNRILDDSVRAETAYQNALKSHNKLNEQVRLGEQNLKNAGISTSGSGSSSFSPRMRAAIAAVRKANPNTKLTDEQLAERIRMEKGIQ